ncbi:MAG: GNAT family N-acetyltransferase [Gammaproteobacteria bacterium]|nr:GNAT family N-acetyltransferase [Gammaproteobacteria bacterium]
MTTLQLKKVQQTESEIDFYYTLLKRCGVHMYQTLKLEHWYPYMDKETFKNKIKDKQMYGVFKNNLPIATFNLTTQPRDYYSESLWNTPAEKALYFGQFGIDPDYQKGGIGQWCIEQVEEIARQLDCAAVRFDGLLMHPWLKHFYMKLGYQPCGIVKPGKWELLCFDKQLKDKVEKCE